MAEAKKEEGITMTKNDPMKWIRDRERRNEEWGFGTSFYDDVGICHEFILLKDDVWKKNDIFINFAVKLVRLIALETGVPIEYIGYGKWGARLTWEDEDKGTLKGWIERIEKHPTYVAFKEVCEFPTERKDGKQEALFEYLDDFPTLEQDMDIKGRKRDAQKYLSKTDYKKFLRAIG